MTELWAVEWLHPADEDKEENWQHVNAYTTQGLADTLLTGRQRGTEGKHRVRKFVAASNVGLEAIQFCLTGLQAGCTADEVIAAYKRS